MGEHHLERALRYFDDADFCGCMGEAIRCCETCEQVVAELTALLDDVEREAWSEATVELAELKAKIREDAVVRAAEQQEIADLWVMDGGWRREAKKWEGEKDKLHEQAIRAGAEAMLEWLPLAVEECDCADVPMLGSDACKECKHVKAFLDRVQEEYPA